MLIFGSLQSNFYLEGALFPHLSGALFSVSSDTNRFPHLSGARLSAVMSLLPHLRGARLSAVVMMPEDARLPHLSGARFSAASYANIRLPQRSGEARISRENSEEGEEVSSSDLRWRRFFNAPYMKFVRNFISKFLILFYGVTKAQMNLCSGQIL